MPREKLVILFIAADTHPDSYTRMGDAQRAIHDALATAQLRDRFDLVVSPPIRYGDLQGLLLKHRPHIVHLCVSVRPGGTLELADARGNVRQAPPAVLGDLFAILTDRVRCVVLDGGAASAGTAAIAKRIDFVVGFPDGVQAGAAVDFAAGFYLGLGYGRSVKTAFDLGAAQMALGGCRLKPRLAGKLKAATGVNLLDDAGSGAAPQPGTTLGDVFLPTLPSAGFQGLGAPQAVSRTDSSLAALLDQARAAPVLPVAGPAGPAGASASRPPGPPLDTVRLLDNFDLVRPSADFNYQLSQLASEGLAGFAVAGDLKVVDQFLRPRLVKALRDNRGRLPSTTASIPLLSSDLDAAASPIEAVQRKLNSAFSSLLSQERVDRLLVVSSHGVPLPLFADFVDRFMADAEVQLAPLARKSRSLFIIVWVYNAGSGFAARTVRLLAPALQLDPTFDVAGYIEEQLAEAQVPADRIRWCVAQVVNAVQATGGQYADIVVQLEFTLAQVCC